MSLRLWAIKVGELRPLDAGGLLLFGARCALRVSPWVPKDARRAWQAGLDIVLRAVGGEQFTPERIREVSRLVGDAGAIACNRLDGTKDEARGRCMNYATQTLVAVLDASQAADLKAQKKWIIDAAKLSASIPALLAHAGQIQARAGDAVSEAAGTIWDAIRADIPVVTAARAANPSAPLSEAKLKALGPLWPGGKPEWA